MAQLLVRPRAPEQDSSGPSIHGFPKAACGGQSANWPPSCSGGLVLASPARGQKSVREWVHRACTPVRRKWKSMIGHRRTVYRGRLRSGRNPLQGFGARRMFDGGRLVSSRVQDVLDRVDRSPEAARLRCCGCSRERRDAPHAATAPPSAHAGDDPRNCAMGRMPGRASRCCGSTRRAACPRTLQARRTSGYSPRRASRWRAAGRRCSPSPMLALPDRRFEPGAPGALWRSPLPTANARDPRNGLVDCSVAEPDAHSRIRTCLVALLCRIDQHHTDDLRTTSTPRTASC
jgi:hypothetical protein